MANAPLRERRLNLYRQFPPSTAGGIPRFDLHRGRSSLGDERPLYCALAIVPFPRFNGRTRPEATPIACPIPNRLVGPLSRRRLPAMRKIAADSPAIMNT